MPTRDVQIWGGTLSDNVHDNSSQAASDVARNSSPAGHKSSSTSTATSTTTDSTDKSSAGGSRKGINNIRKFPFSSGSVEIKTPPPPPTTVSRAVVTTVDVKRNTIFPVGWLLGTMVRDVYNAISQWILEGISAWLLQRSFLGNVHRQVFRDLRHRMKAGPLSILVTPPPLEEIVSKKKPILAEQETRKAKAVKLVDEPDSDLVVTGRTARPGRVADAVVAQEDSPVIDESGGSHTVQWVIFAIEVMALIPIVVIGLSLFYILAVGIYNDLQDLLRRLFGENEPEDRGGPNETSPGEF